MATGRDPWDWSVDQVIDYFDKFRLSSVEHRPHSALPAALELEKLFRLHDINGSTLLSDVDSTVLREDFQIFSFGQRSAIVYAIRQLRQNSSKYKVRLPLFLAPSAAVTSPPLSHVSLPDRVIGKSLAAQSPSQSLSEAFCSPTRYLTQGDESQNLTFTGPDQPTRVRPGETLIEDQFGRKRRKLTLPPTASSVQGVDVDLKHSGNIVNAAHQKDAPDRASAPNEFDNTLTDSVKNAAIANDTCHEPASCSKRPSGGTFLCRKAIPIDHIFYRDTKFGQSIEDSSTKNAVDALVTDGVEDEFQVVSDGRVSPGDRHFVSNSLKYYFLKAEERQLSIGGMQLLGIYPYPERLVREGSRRSVTVFRPIEGGYEAIRDDAILPGQLPQNDASETSEWDYLSRWQNEDSTVLPYFGESDTEVDFSSGLLQEMEDEEREEEEAKMNKKGPLSLDRVEEIIEGETENLRELWKKRKLPLRESAARSIWFKAGGPRRRAYFVSSTRSKIEKLNVRLVKLKDSILGEVWTKESDVREQCEIMEETVFELQESQHKKSIWEGPTAPAASKKPTKKSKSTRKRESDGEDLVNSDSVMEEDQLADFVVPDDSIADGMQLDDHINVEPDKHTTSPEKDASSTDLKTSDLEPMSEDVDMMDPLSSDGSQTHEIKREPSQALDDETDGAQTQIEASTPKRNSNGADIIELTSSSEQEEEHPIEKMKIEEAEEDERKCETASAEEVSSWRWSELIEQNDRKRLVVKILRTLGPKRYNELRPNVLNPSKEVFTDRFERAMEALRRVNEVLSEPADGNIIAMKRFVRLYVCWVHCLHKYWENSASAELQDRLNEDQVKNLIDYGQYYDFVKSIFTENKTPIIFTLGSPDKDFKNPLNGRKDLICISSGSSGSPGSSEAETDVEMPVRAGKKVVAESKEAKEKRERAHLRKKEQEEREKILRAQLGNMSASTDRIIVNTAKKDEHDFIYLNAHIGSRIKKHQVEGLQFMWREIVSAGQGVARPEMQGCLLAHTMGLGKTMQAIALAVTIAESAKSNNPRISEQVPESLRFSRTLIVCPSSLIMNWQDELLLWTPLPRFDNIGELYFLFTEMRMDERLETINEWYKKGGILTVSYDLLRQMIANKPKKPDKVAPLDEARHGKLVDQLIDGPNIIIADEAHRMKNLNSRTSEVTSRFASRSRVALTGSPLANNLKEYFAMIDWISPGYLGDFTEFKSRFQDPIEHGLYSTSSKGERRAALKLLQVLKIILEPKIHRADITVLKGSLKPKVEFVISVSLTPLQEDAYKLYVRHLSTSSVESVSVMRVWSWLAVLSLLCNHPKVFLEKLQEQTKDSSKMKSRAAVSYDTQTDRNLSDEQISNALETLGDEHVSKIGLPSGLIHEQEQLIRREPDVRSPRHSQKVVLFMQILSLSKIADDKVLVFSHSIPTLDYLEALFLEKDISYSRLDGKTKMGLRNAMAHDFNKGKTDVFLISTRAGGLGFNLPGANRVVLFDFNFNPTWEEQAIGRAYRIGQEKPVYVYRFISAGTFETNVYNKAVFKTQLASRVVDKKNPKSHASKSKDYLYEPRHTPLEDVSGVIGKDPVVLDQILAARRQKNDTHIRSITTTETLQADAGDDLTEAELQEVYKMREEENLRKDNPQLYDARRVAAQMALINESARTIRVNSMQMSVDSSRPVGTLPNVVPNVGVVNQVPPPVREVQAPRTSNTVPNGNLPMNSLGISGGVVPIPQNYGLADTTNVQATSNSKPRNATDDMQKSTNTTAQQMKIDAPNVPTVPAKLSKDMQNNAIAAGQHRQNDVQQIPTSISQKAINDAQNSSKSEHVKNVSPNSLTGVTKHPEDSTQAKPNTAVPSVKAGTEKKSSTITSLSKAASESKISLTDQQAKSRTRNVPFTAQSEPPPVGNASSAQSASIGKTERRAAYSRANWRLKNTPFSYEEEAPKRKPGRPRKSELSIAEAVANYKRKIATVVKENDVVSTTAEEGSGGRIGANSSKPISAPTSGGGMKSKGPASRPDSGSSSGSGSGSAFASAPSSRPVSSSRPDAGSRLGSLNGKRSMSDVNGARNADNKTAKAKNNSESQDTVESTSPPDECVIS